LAAHGKVEIKRLNSEQTSKSEFPLLWWSPKEDVGIIRLVVEMMLSIVKKF